MNIKIYSIDKKSKNSLYNPIIEHFVKISKKFATVEVIDIFNKNISKAQDISPKKAQEVYAKEFSNFTSRGYSVVLDKDGVEFDSVEFAHKLLENRQNVSFFIGGAFGFDREFINRCNASVSFGKITLSHKLAKAVLLEQIYRGLTIINNHPYHK
jgi:23S rRNA (pseudouridine1915-N3)-methyltransferase